MEPELELDEEVEMSTLSTTAEGNGQAVGERERPTPKNIAGVHQAGYA